MDRTNSGRRGEGRIAMTRRLPSFVVIGAVKAATTWVAHQLRSQPGVFLPREEPHFFSRDYGRGMDWYAGLFEHLPFGTLIGEKSADYLAYPDAPRRLAEAMPGARLIVQLRDPVERAYSDYCMLFRRGTVDKRIERHLRPGGPQPRFLEDGYYARHLSRWLDHFSRDQLLVLLSEDVASAPDETMRRVAQHIGYERPLVLAQPEVRQNDSRAPALPPRMRALLAPLKPVAAPLRQKNWFRRLHSAMAAPPPYPPLTAELRRELRNRYADDVEALSAIIGRDLSTWKPQRPFQQEAA